MQPKLDLGEIFSILDNSPLIVKKQVITADEIAERAVYKIRCQLLIPTHKMEIRFVKTEDEIFYSYQLFTERPIVRWDNAPHFPEISSHPHHFHNRDGEVQPSKLKGMPKEDLPVVLAELVKFMF